jgi:hypothetical protein
MPMRLLDVVRAVKAVGEPRVEDRHHIDTSVCRKIMLRLVHVGVLPGGHPPPPGEDRGEGYWRVQAVLLPPYPNLPQPGGKEFYKTLIFQDF